MPNTTDTKKASFVQFERRILLDLVRRHHDIVQDRRTDSTSVYRKQQTWQQIADDYNHHPSIARPREVLQLKRLWQNTRARAKQAGVGRVSAVSAAQDTTRRRRGADGVAAAGKRAQKQRKDTSEDEEEEDEEEEDSVDSNEHNGGVEQHGSHADDLRYIDKCRNPRGQHHAEEPPRNSAAEIHRLSIYREQMACKAIEDEMKRSAELHALKMQQIRELHDLRIAQEMERHAQRMRLDQEHQHALQLQHQQLATPSSYPIMYK